MKNVPNMLTIFRIIAVPFILFIMFYFDLTSSWILLWGAGSLFIVAVLTDVLDGYLARKYDVVSDFGIFMDPIADKFLVLSVMLGFLAIDPPATTPINYIIPVIIILVREFVITVMRMFAAKCPKAQNTLIITLFTFIVLCVGSLSYLARFKSLLIMKYIVVFIVIILAFSFIMSSKFLTDSKKGVVLAANSFGKSKTVIQTVCLLVYFCFFTIKFAIVGYVAMWIAAAVTLVSGIVYIYRFMKYKKLN